MHLCPKKRTSLRQKRLCTYTETVSPKNAKPLIVNKNNTYRGELNGVHFKVRVVFCYYKIT